MKRSMPDTGDLLGRSAARRRGRATTQAPSDAILGAATVAGPGDATSASSLRDAELLADFVDFLELGDTDPEASLAPDPVFQERLRSRLWRIHVLARLRASDGLH